MIGQKTCDKYETWGPHLIWRCISIHIRQFETSRRVLENCWPCRRAVSPWKPSATRLRKQHLLCGTVISFINSATQSYCELLEGSPLGSMYRIWPASVIHAILCMYCSVGVKQGLMKDVRSVSSSQLLYIMSVELGLHNLL